MATGALVIALSQVSLSGAAETSGVSSASSPQSAADEAGVSAPEKCPRVLAALRFYGARYDIHVRAIGQVPKRLITRPKSCAQARYLAHVLQRKARAWRLRAERYIAARTLHDFSIHPGSNAWLRAVEEVQRVYPGSRSWLRSCSAAEGGWGRWVVHGGDPYYADAEYDNISSGHLQYRWLTFKGHYRRALEDLRHRGYRVPKHLRVVSVTAWRSALGQALAGGWGILHGQRSHWYASFGRGC